LRGRLIATHAFLEFTDTLAKAFHNFRNLAAAKKDQNYDGNNQQMHGAVPHRAPTFHAGRVAPDPPQRIPQSKYNTLVADSACNVFAVKKFEQRNRVFPAHAREVLESDHGQAFAMLLSVLVDQFTQARHGAPVKHKVFGDFD
jgi:hypothetical protein